MSSVRSSQPKRRLRSKGTMTGFTDLEKVAALGGCEQVIRLLNARLAEFRADCERMTNPRRRTELSIREGLTKHKITSHSRENEERWMRAQKDIRSLRIRCDELELERDAWRLRSNGVEQWQRRGPQPRRDAVEFVWDKRLGHLTTSEVARLKGLILNTEEVSPSCDSIDTSSSRNSRSTSMSGTMSGITSMTEYHRMCVVPRMLEFESELDDRAFRKSMQSYLRQNGLWNGQPIVSDVSSDEALESVLIRRHRVSALVGQRGLLAKTDLAKGTVLGQYLGVEFTEEEFSAVFDLTPDGCQHDLYAFNTQLKDGRAIVVDALEAAEKGSVLNHLLLSVNDCRLHIEERQPSEDDSKYWNVHFATVYCDGWPCLFALTRCSVSKGTELCAFYGADYHRSLRSLFNARTAKDFYQKQLDGLGIFPLVRADDEVSSSEIRLE